ncbi:hypothetical protein APED_03450 [Acanthopleuribacter pedis]
MLITRGMGRSAFSARCFQSSIPAVVEAMARVFGRCWAEIRPGFALPPMMEPLGSTSFPAFSACHSLRVEMVTQEEERRFEVGVNGRSRQGKLILNGLETLILEKAHGHNLGLARGDFL